MVTLLPPPGWAHTVQYGEWVCNAVISLRHLVASVRHGRRLFTLGLALTLIGALVAHLVQTTGGIRVTDVRFKGADGSTMSALLYVPPGATATAPAPGILAVHGYINSRETQSGFAIEFARRGYVVLALDQRGHGYSAAPAFAAGFGGPDGLAYLRSLAMVDRNNIGLEGHSMGGWAVLAAAAVFPDDYKSMVLEGSSTGAPFAAEGTPSFPRNVAVVFSRYDEFSRLMWGVRSAREVAESPKLWALFGVSTPVEAGRIYGSAESGTARVLYSPRITHAMDHLSPEAIGYSIDWFQKTLSGGKPLPVDDQVWIWKEFGTLVAFIGFVALLLGTFDSLLMLPWFAPLVAAPMMPSESRGGRWWLSLVIGPALPAVTLLPFFQLAEALAPASRLFPQSLTNQIAVWAVLNSLLTLGLSFVPGGAKPQFNTHAWRSVAIAALTVAIGYAALAVCDFLFTVDFRFWVLALKLLSRPQWTAFFAYLIPFTLFFVVTLRALHSAITRATARPVAEYLINVAALAGGFIVFLKIQYGLLLTTGSMWTFFDRDVLRTIIAIQFVPLMSIVAIIATFTYRRTNSYLPGAFICALFVTWYIVAGQATHVAA
jgi:pimeloyl-ACP methyl ester carboxylesterase